MDRQLVFRVRIFVLVDWIGRFRCPVWSPSAYQGESGVAGSANCKVRIGLRPVNTSTIHWSVVQNIPNVWGWCFKKTYIDWDGSAHACVDDIELFIDIMGYGVDVDGIWVQSGL